MAPSNDKEIWQAIAEINKDNTKIQVDIAEINGNVKTFIALFETHIKDASIHQHPPCDNLKSLSTKLWAVTGGFLLLAIGTLWDKATG
jgi:ABC-type metal ion transport system substrate-binding protein